MHTSNRLAASDFSFWQSRDRVDSPISFSTFCPGYHELDRVGVVSPCLEDGVLYTGQMLLSLTTAFYDSHRARAAKFFDYPQHFAFVGADSEGICTNGNRLLPHTPHLWDAWSWLDVWPANKWITALPTANAMLERIFDYQINRLFWPYMLKPTPGENPLPDYAYKMLHTRLKSVHYYSPQFGSADTLPVFEVRPSSTAAELLDESIARLPEAVQPPLLPSTIANRFQPVAVREFLGTMRSIAML
jgi:hypothetical protein